MSQSDAQGVHRRDVMWISLDERIVEHVQVTESVSGFTADGVILRPGNPVAQRIRYHVEGDASWNLRRVSVEQMDGTSPPVALASDGAGHWTDGGGRARPDLDGCRDIDIQASPFTNTLAIRRLRLAVGQSAEIRVAYVTVPELEVRPFRQRYTHVGSTDDGSTYRYDSLESDFRADLPVDADGLLLEYPGYFRRAGSAARS